MWQQGIRHNAIRDNFEVDSWTLSNVIEIDMRLSSKTVLNHKYMVHIRFVEF